MIDLNPEYLRTVERILAEHVPDCEVRAFGSRVTWTAKDYSDLDLAIVGSAVMDADRLRLLREAFEESDLPIRVDVIDWHAISASFRKVIEGNFEVIHRVRINSLGMEDEWRDCLLEELAAPIKNSLVGGPFGSELVSADYSTAGVPVIRGENLSVGRWVAGEFVFVPPAKAELLKANTAGALDIVFTQRGANHYRQVALVPADVEQRLVISQSQMKLTVDRKKADPLFVYYLFRCPLQQEYLLRNAIQTGVPHTNLSILRKIPLRIPSLQTQRAITHILGSLDDKIELNRRMTETLDAMTRTLFKSWFVEFDPVRAKAEGRDSGLPKLLADLFPSAFVESDLGEIPEGWTKGCFGDVVEQLRDAENPRASANTLFRHYSIPAFDEGGWPKSEFGHAIKSMKLRVPPGVMLLSKLNPEIERVWLVDVHPSDRAVCSTEFLVLRPRLPFGRFYPYCLARSPAFRRQIETLVTGTSKSHQRAHAKSILDLSVILPPARVATAFDAIATHWLNRMLGCWRESRSLATLRDTLLPKLISGELRIPYAERIVGRYA